MIGKRILLTLALFSLLISGLAAVSPVVDLQTAGLGECRFGVTVATWNILGFQNKTVSSFDIPTIGAGYYLDWGAERSPAVPKYISYVNVISVKDGAYLPAVAGIKAIVENNPGALWIIGNEPDDRTGQQDDLFAEVYAQRFYNIATTIRVIDPTARIGFGTIVMATRLRIEYLRRAWNALIQLAGSSANASALVDIWTPHGFILNEDITTPTYTPWGSGIPLGFDDYPGLATIVEPINPVDMKSVPMFKERMQRFRQFMKDIGEQNKPMWLTEFGVLAPSQSPPDYPRQLYTIPQADTAQFFTVTTDWMESLQDPAVGMPADSNRLVQKWFWYSLNDALYHFGGTLVDPLTLNTTLVGNTYINYEPPAGTEPFLTPDVEPLSLSARAISRLGTNRELVQYIFTLRIRNHVVDNHLTSTVINLYDSNNVFLGTFTGKTNRCGGDLVITTPLIALNPAITSIRVVVNPVIGPDANPANNEKVFSLSLGLPNEYLMPVIFSP